VLSELVRLRDDKAAGADDLVPRFLSIAAVSQKALHNGLLNALHVY